MKGHCRPNYPTQPILLLLFSLSKKNNKQIQGERRRVASWPKRVGTKVGGVFHPTQFSQLEEFRQFFRLIGWFHLNHHVAVLFPRWHLDAIAPLDPVECAPDHHAHSLWHL